MIKSEILQLEGITKRYGANLPAAVHQISLTLMQGEILGLLGPSGCGKTTLLRLIAGFEHAEEGRLWLNSHVMVGSRQWTAPEQRQIGMVFQNFALFPHLTVADNVIFGLQQDKKSSPEHKQQRQSEVLDLVGLLGMENRYPHELSGGQQQRVALARALAPQPQLVLLDEPLSNLDVQVRLRLRQELRDILKAAGTTAIFVTHDQEEALAIADQVAVMRKGCLEQMGTPEDIYQHPQSQFVAEFVTQANFLNAQRQGDTWKTEVGCFATCEQVDLAPSEHTNAVVMIRQEDLILKPDQSASTIIRDRQFLGREYRYCLKTESGQELHARSTTAGTALPVGTSVRLSVVPQNLKIFPQSLAQPAQIAA